jgi:chemotaxis family two-component system response regulator Rcp1
MYTEGRKAQILVVEDNPADVELLRLALATAELDHDLTVITDGGEALAYAEQKGKYSTAETPDLAILDLNLPKNGGLEILAAMRRNPAFDSVAITILSSSSWPRERDRMGALRVERFITKPYDLDEYMQIGFVLKQMLFETAEARA